MSRSLDLFYAMRFLKLLSTPFDEWKAFKLGLIDDDGKTLRKAKNKEEKDAATAFTNIARNIKRILNKFPGGRIATSSLAVGLILIREECASNDRDSQLIFEAIQDELTTLGFGGYNEILESVDDNILPVGRYTLISPFYPPDLIYIKEEIHSNISCFLPIFEIKGVRGKKYFVTKEHIKAI